MKKNFLLFALMLLSFVSAWAEDPVPASVNVLLKGGTANQTVVLKAVGLFEANGYATLVKGSVAPVAYETAASTTAYSNQEIVKATTNEDGSLTLTSVTGSPTIVLNEAGFYFVKVTKNEKVIFVPFQVVLSLNKEIIWNKNSFDEFNTAGHSMKNYFDKWGAWQEGWNVTDSENDLTKQYWRHYTTETYAADMAAHPDQKIIPSWYAVACGTPARYPWVGVVLPQSAVEGTKYKVIATGENLMGDATDLVIGTFKAGGSFVSNKFDYFYNENNPADVTEAANHFILNINETYTQQTIGGVIRRYGTSDLGKVYTAGAAQIDANVAENLQQALSEEDYNLLNNLKLFAAPAGDIYGGFEGQEGVYAGLFDYAWSLSPASANYDSKNHVDEVKITVAAKFANGTDASESLHEDDGTYRTPYYTYKVEYFTDEDCKNPVDKKVEEGSDAPKPQLVNAGTYYVKVSILTAVADPADNTSEDVWMSLGVQEFVIAGTGVEFTLMKLEKNYGDADPVFEDKGPAGWVYKSADGNYKSFYTLKDLDGNVIPTTKARLVGVKFQRVDKGEEVYTTSGLGSYSYTVPLTGLKIVTPTVAADKTLPGETTATGWSETAWNTIDLDKPETYTENYQILNGSFEKLHIVPRDLGLLKNKLTIGDVIYNRAKFTAVNPMDAATATPKTDQVNVKGLFFTSNKKDDEGNNLTIPVDFSKVEVTVTAGAENENVSYKVEGEGEEAQTVIDKKGSLTITAKAETNFTGSVTIPFTVRPRNISKKVPDYEFEGGFIKLDPTTKEPVQKKDAQNNLVEKDNPFGTWTFDAWLGGQPIYTGEERIPTALAVAKCEGLKPADNQLLSVVDATTGKGDYTIERIENDAFNGDNGAEVHSYIEASVTVDQSGASDRKIQNWDEAASKWIDADKVNNKVPTYQKPKVIITGVGNFCGTREVEYDIYPKGLDFDNFDVKVAATEYNGSTPNPTVTITDMTWGNKGNQPKDLVKNVDFLVTVDNVTSASEIDVTVAGRGNYTQYITPSVNNKGKNVFIAFSEEGVKKTYGDKDPDLNEIYEIEGILLKDKYKVNPEPTADEFEAGKIFLDDKDQHVTIDKAAYTKLWTDLKAAITFTREPGETVGFYPISFTVDPDFLTPYKENDEVVPFKYVYGNYIINFSDFAVAVEADPEHNIAAADAQAPELEIEKRALTVTALKQSAAFGTIDATTDFTFDAKGNKNYTITGWATGTLEENGMTYNFEEVEGATGDEKEANVINTKADGKAKIVVLPSSTTFAVGTPVTLTPDVDPHGTVLDNYKFNWKSAALTVTPAMLIATAKNLNKVYGQNPATIDYEYEVTGYQFAEGTTKEQMDAKYADIKDKINKYKPEGAPADYVAKNLFHQIVPEPEEGEEDQTHGGKDVGTYVIDIDRNEDGSIATKIVGEGALAKEVPQVLDKYENYAITYVPAELTIAQKRLDVYALNQTIGYGEEIVTGTGAEGKLVLGNVIFDDVDGASATSDPEKGDIYEKRRAEVLNTNPKKVIRMLGIVTEYGDDFTDFTINVARLDDPAVTAVGKYDPDKNENTIGILVGVAPMENYDIHVHYGIVEIVGDARICLVRPLLNTEELWNADKQQGAEIWFTATEEKDGKDVTVYKNTDYAKCTAVAPNAESIVPNTAAQYIEDYDGQEVTVTFGNFAMLDGVWYPMVFPFNVTMKELSPYFGYALVNVLDVDKSTATNMVFKKVLYDIPANTPFLVKGCDNTNLAKLTFAGKEIVNPESEDDLTVTAAGNSFVGTYTGYNRFLEGDDVQRGYLGSDGKLYDNSKKFYMFPLGAYFKFGEEAAAAGGIRLTLEDENGVQTIISGVSAQAEVAYGEGWYTITGVKLTSEPTVSGTYIYNGKKVFFQAK